MNCVPILQMAQIMPTEARQIEEGAKPMHTEECRASTSTCTPFFPYGQPSSMPLHWHSIPQPLEAAIPQCRSEKDHANPSIFPVTETWRPNLFTDQRNSRTLPSSGALLYALPLPCFFPLYSPPNAAPPHSSNAIDRQNDTHLSNQCSCAGPPCQSSLPLKISRENYSSPPTVLADDHHHSGFEMPPERRHRSEGTRTNRMVLMPTPLNCVRPSSSSAGGRLNVTLQQESSGEDAVFPVSGHAANPVFEENREPTAHGSRKPVDSGSTAEARRRRKELMKLKANQAGQFPTN